MTKVGFSNMTPKQQALIDALKYSKNEYSPIEQTQGIADCFFLNFEGDD